MTERTDTVERTVQLTGGSTYTVSLPKEWADEQGVDPGTDVTLHMQSERLVMTRGDDPEGRVRETVIDAATREPATLERSVAAAYITGCEVVRVENLHDSTKRRAVTGAIRQFVGFEVMTEDATGLVARTMLDVADLSPARTLTQMERTTLDMHAAAVEALVAADGALGEQVTGQDDTVDRLFALVSREFQRALVDPEVTTEEERSPFEYYMAARQLERIADHAEKMAGLAGRLTVPPPEDIGDDIVTLGEASRSVVRRALAGLLEAGDEHDPGGIVTDAETLLGELAALDEQLYERELADGYLLGLVVDSLVRTTEYGVNIAEAGIRSRHRI